MIKMRVKPQLIPLRVDNTFDDTLLTDPRLEQLTDYQLSVDYFIANMSEDSNWTDILSAIASDSQSSAGNDSHPNENISNLVEELRSLEATIQSQETQGQPDPSELLNDDDNNLMVDPISGDMTVPVLFNAQAPTQVNPPMSITVSQTSSYPHSVPSPHQDTSHFGPQHSPMSSVSHQLGEISLGSPFSQAGAHSPEQIPGQVQPSIWPLNPINYQQPANQSRQRSRSDCLFAPNLVSVTVAPTMATTTRSCRPSVPYHRSNTDPMPSTSSQILPHFTDTFPYGGMASIASSSQASLSPWPSTSVGTSTTSLSVTTEPVFNQTLNNRRPRTSSEPILYHQYPLDHNYPVPYRREGQRRGRPSTRTGHRQQTQREKRDILEQELCQHEHNNYHLKLRFAKLMSEINHLKLRMDSMGIRTDQQSYQGEAQPWTTSRQQ